MKTKYKYIEFEFIDRKNHKKGGFCKNKKTKYTLGYWDFHKPWNQYVIEFMEDCVFNESCLQDIAHFLNQLNGKPKDKDNG